MEHHSIFSMDNIPSNQPNSVYPQAHSSATPQSGPVSETLYNAQGNVMQMLPNGQYPRGVSRVEWSVQNSSGNRVIIQTLQ